MIVDSSINEAISKAMSQSAQEAEILVISMLLIFTTSLTSIYIIIVHSKHNNIITVITMRIIETNFILINISK